MITRENFITIMNAFDEYWNEKLEALKALDIHECYFHSFADTILDALEAEIDPKKLARTDDLTYDCGAFLAEWLFGEGKLQEKCPDAGSLYDYICEAYKKSNESKEKAE